MVLLGNGDGTFGRATTIARVGINWVVLADFNHDGKLDAAGANYGQQSIDVFYGDGTGAFTLNHSYPTTSASAYITTADVNRDGHVDLLTADDSSATISELLGRSDGRSRPPGPTPRTATTTGLPSPTSTATTSSTW